MAKAFARKFYSSKAWQDCRNEYVKSVHHLCENCLRKGIYKPGAIVHHKIEIDPITIEKPEITLNFDNLEYLCRACHAEKHPDAAYRWKTVNDKKKAKKKEKDRYDVDEYGRVTAKTPPLGIETR